MGILKAHMDAVEDQLLATSRIPANSGHSLHKGTPREAFIRQYLEDHLSQNLAIGTGEIIDATSEPNQPRNQLDVVLYRRTYPKLSFGGGINAFLAESVVATIEVKSTLTAEELTQGIRTARRVKSLRRHIVKSFMTGYQPPGILSYLVAYDGPARMKTVHGWIDPIHKAEGIVYPTVGSSPDQRLRVKSPSLDGIFVLGRGFLQFDNMPIGFITDAMRQQHPDTHWAIGDTPRGALLLLFMCLTMAISGTVAENLDPMPYLADFKIPDGGFTLGR
jgi:hypothetical protein